MAASKIPIDSQLIRRNNADFVLVDDNDLGGGFRVVPDIPTRDAIALNTPSQLKVGMQVVVQAPAPVRIYRLAQLSPVVWVEGERTVVEYLDFASFPPPATVPGQIGWAQLENAFYASVEGAWVPLSSVSGITAAEHRELRQLIHFVDNGPAFGFLTGAFRETLPLGSPFPTTITWWESAAKLKRIVDKTIAYNPNKTPSTIQWRMFDVDGVTVIETVVDTFAYSGVFETSRTRSIS